MEIVLRGKLNLISEALERLYAKALRSASKENALTIVILF
jgi:hypothetical protein